ncbi:MULTISPECIES: hypothetical protein [Clostridium]|uniref:hypothetical protein n=1 Tax=Clostridium TaxID=1485 RepID=UPI00066653AE|nr:MULTISPECIES: hypothetical protein [Clostridium]MDU1969380.1 hypothetical protein [Clostridium perfringens]MDB2077050.1 hypothetical protein [Clostridium paraputrificum]MDB2077422.1 hypothetical protein [Clostridium paraputrificum]MDB2091971.1 hypothetical protein [Clostridium paraputrificum]MDB2107251.1 hypothetical protein [Clostridium paraputrificum]
MTKIKKKSYLLLLFLILVLVSFLTFSKKQTIDTYNSNNYSIKIKAKDSFSFGPNKIFIYYKTKDDIFYNHLFDTLLFNDGSTISKDNFKVEFKNNNCILSLSGCEGSSSYLISFSENKVSYTDISGIQSN